MMSVYMVVSKLITEFLIKFLRNFFWVLWGARYMSYNTPKMRISDNSLKRACNWKISIELPQFIIEALIEFFEEKS